MFFSVLKKNKQKKSLSRLINNKIIIYFILYFKVQFLFRLIINIIINNLYNFRYFYVRNKRSLSSFPNTYGKKIIRHKLIALHHFIVMLNMKKGAIYIMTKENR